MISSNRGSTFISQVIKEAAYVPRSTLEPATTKHAHTIGMFGRKNASLKEALKIETCERRSIWHKYVNITVLCHKTSYHTSLACEPSPMLHGNFQWNVSALKVGDRPQKPSLPNYQIGQVDLEQTEMTLQLVLKKAMQAHIKCKVYYNKEGSLLNVKTATTSTACSRKQIIKSVSFFQRLSLDWAVHRWKSFAE